MARPLPIAFQSLSEVLYTGTPGEVDRALCSTAVELVDGCDHASLMQRERGRVFTRAASDEVAVRVDELELEIGSGPCVDTLADDEPDHHFAPDIAEHTQWPELGRRVLAETSVRGMAGFRLRQEGNRLAALNLFSDRAGALTQVSMDQAAMLAAFGSVALTALQRGEQAETLRRGLQSNREIGKAVGLLMALHSIDDEEAFRMLSRVSQEMNVKVVELAARLLRQHGPESPEA